MLSRPKVRKIAITLGIVQLGEISEEIHRKLAGEEITVNYNYGEADNKKQLWIEGIN